MSDRDNIVRDTAIRDYEEIDEIIIPPEATVEETADGYWVSAFIYVPKEAV